MIRLETERLVLRPLMRSDLAAYEALGVEDARREVEEAADHWAEHGFGQWAIIERASERMIGALEVHYAGEGIGGIEADEVEIGWVVAGDRRGHGGAVPPGAVAQSQVRRGAFQPGGDVPGEEGR